jgi:hypothetical protein
MIAKPEKDESIWLLTISPTIWAAHFMACYLTAAIWCAKTSDVDAAFGIVRTSIGIYTLVAVLSISAVAWVGYRRHVSRSAAHGPHDTDTPEDRHSFLGFATLLLSGLSLVATLFVALVALFVGSCN